MANFLAVMPKNSRSKFNDSASTDPLKLEILKLFSLFQPRRQLLVLNIDLVTKTSADLKKPL